MTLQKMILLCIILFSGGITKSQVAGCTDPLSNNYNASATVNDGSCTYNTSSYTPSLKVNPMNDTLLETSGLQWAGNYLWSFNDGGGAAAIYRIDTITNAVLQHVYLEGCSNIDWEDIAFDGTYFYIGDFGNNSNGARTDLKIYKFPFKAIPAFNNNPVVTIPAAQISSIHFTYNDQVQPPIANGSNNTKFDCEAMMVEDGKIHLFTKNWIDINSTHYVIDSTIAGTYLAHATETLATGFLVTAADKTVGNKVTALLGYQATGTGSHFLYLLSGYSGGDYFNGNKRKINLPEVTVMGQAEGLCFKNGYYGYISNERFTRTVGGFPVTVTQKLRAFDIRSYVSGLLHTYIFTGSGNWDNASNWTDNIQPPAVMSADSQIVIDPLPGEECILNINYTSATGASVIVANGKKFLIQANFTQN